MTTLALRGSLGRRLFNLYLGLVLFGVSSAMILASGFGLGPWDVFHQGLSEQLDISLGWAVIGVGLAVLLLWIPLRQHPGLGTISNAIVIGLVIDGTLTFLGEPDSMAARSGLLAAGVVCNGVATGLYIGAGLGPGPRDGLMTGMAARGHSIRVVRTAIELSVLTIGWTLGGTVGVGTIVYALSIGPLAHFFIPLLAVSGRPGPGGPSLTPRP
jgi:uncharacterized membrane protein YczE